MVAPSRVRALHVRIMSVESWSYTACPFLAHNLTSDLIAQPYSLSERTHSATIAVGNGLSGEIWHEFVARFGIKRVAEFYASSEGNCNLVNSENKAKSCGFLPNGVARLFFPVNIIKVDEETMEPRSGSKSFTVPCAFMLATPYANRMSLFFPTFSTTGSTCQILCCVSNLICFIYFFVKIRAMVQYT